MSPSKVEPPQEGLPVQTNLKEFMQHCWASLILPENALIIAKMASIVSDVGGTARRI
jgi:hypothetical protein